MAGERDDAYRAIGRYVVEFSRLIHHMRTVVVRRLSPPDHPLLAELALGQSFASNISDGFFAICRELGELDTDEAQIAHILQRDVIDEIKWRNDLAHGDWEVGLVRGSALRLGPDGGIVDPEPLPPRLYRVKPQKKTGHSERKTMTVQELDARSDALWELAQHTAELGAICLSDVTLFLYEEPVRVNDIFRVIDGRVERSGPKASRGRPEFL